MSKFKIGDKVCLIEDYEGWSKGLVGVVNNVHNTFSSEVDGTDMIYTDTFFGVYSFRVELVKEPNVKFTPMPELKTGMRIQYREGSVFIYIGELNKFMCDDGYNPVDYTDLKTGKSKCLDEEWDIVSVYSGCDYNLSTESNSLGELLWEYKKPEIIKTEADILREELEKLQSEQSALKAKLRELGEEE